MSTIICQSCKKPTKKRGFFQKYCPPCAKSKIHEARAERRKRAFQSPAKDLEGLRLAWL